MRLYLIRHAHAGQRTPGGRDRYRPLTPEGQQRAAAFVELFAGVEIDRLLASPATRCLQTLDALSRDRGLPVDEQASLWEGSDTGEALIDLASLDGGDSIVACSHGDIIPAIVDQLGHDGVPIAGRGCELGSVWIVDRVDGAWTEARYVSPRASVL